MWSSSRLSPLLLASLLCACPGGDAPTGAGDVDDAGAPGDGDSGDGDGDGVGDGDGDGDGDEGTADGGSSTDGGPGDGDGDATHDGGTVDGGSSTDDGAGIDDVYVAPDGAYVLLSPVAADQDGESDAMTAAATFTAQLRVGHVEDIQTFGFAVTWDPAVLEHVERERIDAWLTAGGSQVLPLTNDLDDEAGRLTIVFGLAPSPVTTMSSEAVYEIGFRYVDGVSPASLAVDLSDDGLVPYGASEPLDDVAAIGLQLTP